MHRRQLGAGGRGQRRVFQQVARRRHLAGDPGGDFLPQGRPPAAPPARAARRDGGRPAAPGRRPPRGRPGKGEVAFEHAPAAPAAGRRRRGAPAAPPPDGRPGSKAQEAVDPIRIGIIFNLRGDFPESSADARFQSTERQRELGRRLFVGEAAEVGQVQAPRVRHRKGPAWLCRAGSGGLG